MSLKDQSLLSSKIKRLPIKMNIHNIFIFKQSGICLYGRSFTSLYTMEDNLISAFFSAIRSFTQEVIGEKVKTIEMGDIKFAIIKKSDFFYGFLCNSSENVLVLEDIVEKIHKKYVKFAEKYNVNMNVEYIKNNDFDVMIDKAIKEILSTEYDLKKEEDITLHLEDFSQNGEINGTVLLTDKGKVIYSSLRAMELRNLLKEVDFRVKIYNNTILKMFYTNKNQDLIFSEYVNDLYYIILIFDNKIKFGIAEYYLQKIVKYMKETLNN